MNKNFNNILRGTAVIAAILTAGIHTSAQNLQSGYFDDNFLYRFQSNPAFANEGRGFVAMPGLGNLNVGTNGTLGVKHILYNVNGRTTTALNPEISAAEVLDGMKDKGRIGVNLRETVVACGFKALGGYNTVTIGTRADVNVSLPKDIFRLAKEGPANSTYDLSNLGARGAAWAEIGLGHSRDINKRLRVGATFKVLLGVGGFSTNIRDARLQLGENSWDAVVDAELKANIKGMRYKQKYNEDTHRDYVNGFDMDDFGPIGGFGAAIDLGAVYKLNNDWEFSASLLDLGGISWSETAEASTDGAQKVCTDEYSFNVDNNDTWEKFTDNLSMLYQLDDKGNTGSRFTGIGATLNLAAQYTLPTYRRLKFGALSSTRFNGPFTWTEMRVSAQVEPVKWFSAGINLAE
ncbi:MAG: hypothetical protein K2K72_06635, partial [Duncaniella sp.]|nr:hypothetical protein [Duncaniella sp.]